MDWTGLSANYAHIYPEVHKLLDWEHQAELMEGMQSQDASLERLERNINVMKAKVTAAPVIPPEPPPPRNPAPMVFTVNDDDDDDLTPPAKTPKRSVPGTTLNPGPRDADDEPAPKKRKPGVIVAPSKIYRPGLPSLYRDPPLGDDLLDDSDWIYKENGKSLRKAKTELPPRDDVIEFDTPRDSAELMKNLKLSGCPAELHGQIKSTVVEFWDVFTSAGLRSPIRGYTFEIDTSDSPPVCCKTPRYGYHETQVMDTILGSLEKNGLIEQDTGPWGALVVLAAKPHQDDVPWAEYQWRMCVSYR